MKKQILLATAGARIGSDDEPLHDMGSGLAFLSHLRPVSRSSSSLTCLSSLAFSRSPLRKHKKKYNLVLSLFLTLSPKRRSKTPLRAARSFVSECFICSSCISGVFVSCRRSSTYVSLLRCNLERAVKEERDRCPRPFRTSAL